MKSPKPKKIADIIAALDERAATNGALSDSIAGFCEQVAVVSHSLIGVATRLSASCAELERRVGALEGVAKHAAIDETGNDEAGARPRKKKRKK